MPERAIQRVSVIGGGTMGQGIAIDFALAGRDVTLFNTRPESSRAARGQIERALALLAETGLVDATEAAAALRRITGTTDLPDTADGQDYIVETVNEDLALKHAIIREVERHAPPDAILTTDTSGFPVDDVFAVSERPDRTLATHYFYPAHLVPAVEVAPGRHTDPAVLAAACQLLEACGKRPVVLPNAPPGFLGNCLQQALCAEAFRLVEEGHATPEQIDAALALGIARKLAVVGIFDRLDLVGLERATAVYRAAGKPVPEFLAERIAQGETGAASGRGFYDWPPGAAKALQERVDRHLIAALKADRAAGRVLPPGNPAHGPDTGPAAEPE